MSGNALSKMTQCITSSLSTIRTVLETMTDNETSESGQVGIEKLPVEVLANILTHLNIKDRKNARAVCSLWYDACNQVDILRTEKLHCNGTDELSQILRTLMNSQRRIFNLHFNAIEFNAYPESFWEECGPRILSLDFSNCCFNGRTFEILLRYCSKLEHLSWYMDGNQNALCTNHQLSRISVVRDTLISLDINLNNCDMGWLSNYILFKLLVVFPNIKRFGFTANKCYNFHKRFNVTNLYSRSELLARHRFTLASILNVIASRASVLEKLRLDLTKKYFSFPVILRTRCRAPPMQYACDFIMSIPDLKRLKEIDMPIICGSIPPSQVLHFFSKLRLLESASFRCICGFSNYKLNDFNRDLLLLFLEYCPKLYRLYYTPIYGSCLEIDYILLKKLASSRIKDLKLNSDGGCIVDPKILLRRAWPINWNLSRFSYKIEYGSEPNVFLKLFSNLKEVEFHEVSGKEIQDIWNYKTGLKSLTVSNCPRLQVPVTSRDKQNNENNLAVFKDLEYLDVENSELFLTTWLASESYTPRLKVLRMYAAGYSEADLVLMLPNLVRRLPELEVLSIRFQHKISYKSWITLCSDLKNLRFLSVQDGCQNLRFLSVERECIECSKTVNINYKHLFQIRPTLRALAHVYRYPKAN